MSPIGLTAAPRAFTKLLKPVIAILRSSGMRIVIYLDDILLMHQNHQEIMKIFHMLTGLLENLGFIIKQEKCSPFPTEELVFLGAQLNSKEMTLAVPLEKFQNLQTRQNFQCKSCEKAEMLNARVVSNDWPNEPNGKDWPLGKSWKIKRWMSLLSSGLMRMMGNSDRVCFITPFRNCYLKVPAYLKYYRCFFP